MAPLKKFSRDEHNFPNHFTSAFSAAFYVFPASFQTAA